MKASESSYILQIPLLIGSQALTRITGFASTAIDTCPVLYSRPVSLRYGARTVYNRPVNP
jgi:hypothetical protein